MNQRFRVAVGPLLAALLLSAAGRAHADVTVEGDVWPDDPEDPWDLGPNALVVGIDEGQGGYVTVSRRGTLISTGAVVGRSPGVGGTIEIIGYGSTWINHGAIELAFAHTGASLLVRRGARVITDDLVVTAQEPSEGDVLVEGYDATLTTRGYARIGFDGRGLLTLRQGATFLSNDTRLGGAGTCKHCRGTARVEGSATRWINTGSFAVGGLGNADLHVYRAELSTTNAVISGQNYAGSCSVDVSGWGGTWTNRGLLRVGAQERNGELTVGAYGSLVTEETEVQSYIHGNFIHVGGFQASWTNSGDVTILASSSPSPSLVIERGAVVRLGGLLRTAPLYEGEPPLGPSVRLAGGALIAGAIEVHEGDLDFAGGQLDTGSFVGDLVSAQAGRLVVGEAHPATDIAGSYSQGPGAALRVTVAGANAAPPLLVDGDVHLDGALEVRAADASAAFEAGDSVALLGWTGALSGAFTAVHVALPLAPGLAWDTSALYTTGEIIAVPAP